MKPKYPFIWIIVVLIFSIFILYFFSVSNYKEFYDKNMIIALDHGENAESRISDEYLQVNFILHKIIHYVEEKKISNQSPENIVESIRAQMKKENIKFDYIIGKSKISSNQQGINKKNLDNNIINSMLIEQDSKYYIKLYFDLTNYEYYVLLNLSKIFPKFFKDYYQWFSLGVLAKINNDIFLLDKSSSEVTIPNKNLLKLFHLKNLGSIEVPIYIGVYKNSGYFQEQKNKLILVVVIIGLLILILALYAAYKLFFVEIAKFKAQHRINYLVYHEKEYDILNRVYIEENFHKHITTHNYQKAYIISLGLQNFDPVVNTYGMNAGHALMATVIKQIRQYNKEKYSNNSLLAKYGRNKLLIVIFDEKIDIGLYIRNIIDLCRSPIKFSNQYLFMNLNFGISIYPEDSKNISDLIIKSDIALSSSTEERSENCKFYNIQMHNYIRDNLALEDYLKEAIIDEKFQLVFQPQINLASNTLYGMECLLRLKDHSDQSISPDRFVPLLEKTKMIIPVGKWILKEACKSANSILNEGIDFERISINLSLIQIEDEDFVSDFKEIICESKLPAGKLSLEITESLVSGNHQNISNKLIQLKELGIEIAVDDFGTGYCSLGYLDHYDFDYLKIPKPFVDKIAIQESSKLLFDKMIDIARVHSLRVVVEGVENKEQLDIIKSMGNDLIIQGYYFSKPLNIDDFIEFAKNIKI